MLKNYLTIALRNLYHAKTQTIIKTVGLALALSVSIVIFSWIKNELSYDKFHKDADHIYRLVLEDGMVSSPPGFKLIFDKMPEVESSVRLFKSDFLGEKQKVTYKDKVFTNDEIYYADDDFFKVFSFPLLRGNPANVLNKNNAAVITEEAALKYFGNEDPIGKTLLLSDEKELEVTGVLKNIPANSHFHFDILITLKAAPFWNRCTSISFGSMWIFPTYIKINNHANIASVLQKTKKEIQPYQYKPDVISFQRLTDIHLHSANTGELEVNGDINYIYLFGAVAILIIIMSCINYVNLTTALSVKRIKEIGIRKAIGAAKYQLITQLTSESIIISLISFVISLALLQMVNPLLSFIGVGFFPGIFNESVILISAFLFTIIIGTLTGLFPAFVITKYSMVSSMKSKLSNNSNKGKSRGVLVIFQFAISIVLIICSLLIYEQMRYVQNKKLGYNKEQVLVLNLGRDRVVNNINVLKNSILQNSNELSVTACSQLPTNIKTAEGINTEDGTRYESYYMSVDKNFFKTMGIKVLKGTEQIGAITIQNKADLSTFQNKFVVNRTLLDKIGVKLKDTGTQSIIIRHGNMKPGQIIGVVQDFHFESLHDPIQPLVIEFMPMNEWGNTYLLVKINSKNIPSTIDYIKKKWEAVAEGLPFGYNFLNEDYNALYKTEMQTGHLFLVFTAISLLIIVLGLLGLIAFIANQKTKEIGIRKVLGASIADILLLLSRKFIIWIIIANVIAWPVAYYFINKWLEDFAYRVNLSVWIFVLSGGIALLIALITVSFQAFKAATANPVKSLRYE